MFYHEFREYMLNENIQKTFHYFKTGMIILSGVTNVEDTGSGLEIKFNGGSLTVWDDSRVIKCRRPVNLLRECETCYQVLNEFGEPIGYVYN